MCAKDNPQTAVNDVWDDSCSDEGTPGARQQLDREWQTRHQQFHNAGYREGLDQGKETTLQQGFNAGFAEGVQAGYEFGLVRGALQTLAQLYHKPNDTMAQVRKLLSQLSALPAKTVMGDTCTALLEQPISDPAMQHLQSSLQQLGLEDDILLAVTAGPGLDIANSSAEAGTSPGGSSRGAETADGPSNSSTISSSSGQQQAASLPQQLVAHIRQELVALGFDVGAAPVPAHDSVPLST
eukprot:GHRR01011394.1.p1 GENE.GHRR01011394.1~~GHRR01011394.1.p1  ORF type:complete len:279 (+),score=102.95 GHRR01011394.1:121-837(+)